MSRSDEPEAELARLINAPAPPAPHGLRGLAGRALGRDDLEQTERQRQVDRALLHRIGEIVEAIDQLREEIAQIRQDQIRDTEMIARLGEWLRLTSDRSDEVGGRLEASISDQASAMRDLHRLIADNVPLFADGLELEMFDAGLGGMVCGFRRGAGDVGDAVYVGFEDFFRGREEAIRERQRAYLPLLQGRAPVLDVGCGRGEMLEMLRDDGTEAHGIDLDPAMVEHGRAKGLQVEMGDAVTYLEGLRDGSLGAVFAAQVIEHLPYSEVVRFLRATVGKLVPGGIAILETVNPHAPQALKHFWIDPTHQHPLFPETVLALCRLTGFVTAYVWHPQGCGEPDRDRVEQLDYAVIAESPALA
jgi:2-polyprenyl-3-methyl-5-hydroxy-6-metoxy-1,4-benzoquinol methylase